MLWYIVLQFLSCLRGELFLLMFSRINKISRADAKNRVYVKNKWDRMVDKEEKWFSDVYVTCSLSFSFKFILFYFLQVKRVKKDDVTYLYCGRKW